MVQFRRYQDEDEEDWEDEDVEEVDDEDEEEYDDADEIVYERPWKKIFFLSAAGLLLSVLLVGGLFHLLNDPSKKAKEQIQQTEKIGAFDFQATVNQGSKNQTFSGSVTTGVDNQVTFKGLTDYPVVTFATTKKQGVFVSGQTISAIFEKNFSYKAKGLSSSMVKLEDLVSVLVDEGDQKQYTKVVNQFGQNLVNSVYQTPLDKISSEIEKNGRSNVKTESGLYKATLNRNDLVAVLDAMIAKLDLPKDLNFYTNAVFGSFKKSLKENSDTKAVVSISTGKKPRNIAIQIISKKGKLDATLRFNFKEPKEPDFIDSLTQEEVKDLFEQLQKNLLERMTDNGKLTENKDAQTRVQ